jgi:glycerol kinase
MKIAAIDQGTTSTRCLVFETTEKHAIVQSLRHAQSYPAPGRVEHDPLELLENVRLCIGGAGPVDAIGICNQGESCLAWDALSGEPLSPVIVWQDDRTAGAMRGLAAGGGEALSLEISGLPLDPYFSASKMRWLLGNVPAVADAGRRGRLRLGTTDAFFLDRLCGTFATDVATASRTGLLDLSRLEWSEDLCTLHGIPIECLPEIRANDAGFGTVDGVPLKVSIVDQQAALFGHGCRLPGEAKITFGTGTFLLAVTGEARPVVASGLLPTIAWSRNGQPTFAVDGGLYDAGSAMEWARRIGLFADWLELSAFDGPSAISRGLVSIPAFSGLAAPYWDRAAAPLFLGMTFDTTRRDLARAILEGIAYMSATLVAAVNDTVPLRDTLSVDGGLSNSPYFVQFLADVTGKRLRLGRTAELTALGAALMTSGGTSAEPGIQGNGRIFEPRREPLESEMTRFSEAVRRARSWREN